MNTTGDELPGWDGSDPAPDRSGDRPAEAFRLAAQVQELGFDAARLVVDRFVEMFGSFRGPDAVTFRSDAQRALDAYLALLRNIDGAGLPMWPGPAAQTAAGSRPDRLVLPDVAPGGRSSARMWLHNTSGSAVTAARPWTPGLSGHAGAALPGAAVAFTPARVDRLDPGGSCQLLVVAGVGADAVAGTYHGQVLVDGLPDVALPLVVNVVPPAGAP